MPGEAVVRPPIENMRALAAGFAAAQPDVISHAVRYTGSAYELVFTGSKPLVAMKVIVTALEAERIRDGHANEAMERAMADYWQKLMGGAA